jgi:hypothetical protein
VIANNSSSTTSSSSHPQKRSQSVSPQHLRTTPKHQRKMEASIPDNKKVNISCQSSISGRQLTEPGRERVPKPEPEPEPEPERVLPIPLPRIRRRVNKVRCRAPTRSPPVLPVGESCGLSNHKGPEEGAAMEIALEWSSGTKRWTTDCRMPKNMHLRYVNIAERASEAVNLSLEYTYI